MLQHVDSRRSAHRGIDIIQLAVSTTWGYTRVVLKGVNWLIPLSPFSYARLNGVDNWCTAISVGRPVLAHGQSHVGGVNAGVTAPLKPALIWDVSSILYFAIATIHNISLLYEYMKLSLSMIAKFIANTDDSKMLSYNCMWCTDRSNCCTLQYNYRQ